MSKKILVHGAMKYYCKDCGKSWWMFLEKGLEEPGENHKPVPFIIRCKCGGFARDVSGIIKISHTKKGEYTDLPKGASYFKNDKKYDCGKPVITGNYF
jgi:hypothetical protein